MPKVINHSDSSCTVEVLDTLYEDFLGDCLGITLDYQMSLLTYLDELKPEYANMLSDYIVNRLAEVDPGFVPKSATE
jgi:hypothetical protein